MPLLEIVSEPDIFSAEQARAYVTELRATLLALGVSDVKMEEGSMRVDANVSVRRSGTTELGTRTETKEHELDPLGAKAIESEIERQIERLEAGERVVQKTRHWNEVDGRSRSMRSKEEAFDYRYFPEPDLVPVAPDRRRATRRGARNMPSCRPRREPPGSRTGRSPTTTRVLLDVPGPQTACLPVGALSTGGTPKDVVNWARGEVLAHLHESRAARR